MSETKSGRDRYAARGENRRRDLTGEEFAALGRPLVPADVFVAVWRAARLSEDEVLDAVAVGAAALAEGAQGPLSEVDDRDAAIEAAAEVTRSRITAWRKRGRQMTWDELRIFLLGLRTESPLLD